MRTLPILPLRAATSTSPGFPATLTSGNGRVRYREVRFRESRKNDSEKRHATVDNLGGPVSGGQGMMRSRNDDGAALRGIMTSHVD